MRAGEVRLRRAPRTLAGILFVAGLAWFDRIQRAGARTPVGRAARRGGALLAAGGLLALTGCGQASNTSTAPSQADVPAGHPEQWMPGQLDCL